MENVKSKTYTVEVGFKMTLPPGKIPIDILKEVVFKNLGAKREEVTLGPTTGVDCAVLDLGDKSLIVSMDPITGAVERIGWLAVNVNANDIATFGVEPAFLFSCLMLPEGADKNMVETISKQMNEAATKLGMAIVGGHAESTPGLVNPIVVGCAMGSTKKGQYVTAANAKTGDALILTKSAGIEGTAILASDRETELKKILTAEELSKRKKLLPKNQRRQRSAARLTKWVEFTQCMIQPKEVLQEESTKWPMLQI